MATPKVSGAGRAAEADLRPPCRFFFMGRCKFGEHCTNSHTRTPVCKFWLRGNCGFGEGCKWLHGEEGSDQRPAEPESLCVEVRGGAGARTAAQATTAARDGALPAGSAGASATGSGPPGTAAAAAPRRPRLMRKT